MRKILLFGVCVMAVVWLSGCTTCDCQCPKPPYVDYKDGGNNPPPPPPPPVYEMVKLVERQDVLRVFISGDGATDPERQLAGRLVFQAKGGLASDKAEVRLEKEASDAVLSIRPHLTTVDHDGNYWRLNCEVQSELRASNTKRVFAAKSFKFVAPKRVLGLENAVKQFEDEGGKAVSDWCAKELKHIFDRDVEVALLNIELVQSPADAKRNVVADNQKIMAIGEGMRQMPGLISYELTGRNESQGTCTYRVVYFRKDYPNGIGTHVSVMANRIVRHR